jgi:hypothetical protein
VDGQLVVALLLRWFLLLLLVLVFVAFVALVVSFSFSFSFFVAAFAVVGALGLRGFGRGILWASLVFWGIESDCFVGTIVVIIGGLAFLDVGLAAGLASAWCRMRRLSIAWFKAVMSLGTLASAIALSVAVKANLASSDSMSATSFASACRFCCSAESSMCLQQVAALM